MENKLSYEALKRRLLAGSDRLPTTEQLPVQEVTAALASENLRRRAGFPILRLEEEASKPEPAPEGKFPGPELSRAFKHILSGVYLPVLPEYIECLRSRGLDLPPEYLPAFFEYLRRNPEATEPCFPLPGTRVAWILEQNPKWKALFAWTEADFFRAKSDDRMRLFRHVRKTDPSKATSWLETCWHEETVKQKRLFLGALEMGLSAADLPLLEKALKDKNREVRYDAALLCGRLRAGSVYQLFRTFAKTYMTGEGNLAHRMQWVTFEHLAPLVHFGYDVADAHASLEVLRMLLVLVHLDDLCADLHLPSAGALFDAVDPVSTLPFVVEALVLHNNAPGATALMDWLTVEKAPELWSSTSLYKLVCHFPDLLEHPNWRPESIKPGVFWEVLETHEQPWDARFLPLLLQTMTKHVRRNNHEIVRLHNALLTAGWYAPAVSGRKALSVLPPEMRSSREMLKLEDVLIFRQLLAVSG
ncbi:MAG: hypothetical protein IT270_15995 [Saprospiraceae bacterium]|nr:hypothetical protein [Saprospiraceae bacterium]